MAIPEAASMTTPSVLESQNSDGQNNELPDVVTGSEGGPSNGNASNSLNESQLQQHKEHLEKLQELHRQILIEQQKLKEMQGGGIAGGLDFNVSGDTNGIGDVVGAGDASSNLLDSDQVADFARSLAQGDNSSPSSIKDVVLPTGGEANGSSAVPSEGMLPPPTLSSPAVFATVKTEESTQKRKNSWRKKWHSDRDLPHRREVIRRIAELLLQRKRNPEDKWKTELPYKARRLEEQLYKTASSFEEYINEKTLRNRLKVVATAITSKFRDAKRKHRSISDGASMRERFAKSKMASMSQSSFSSLMANLEGDASASLGPGKLTGRSFSGSLGSMGDLSASMGGQTSQSLQDQLLLNLKAQQQQRVAGMAGGGSMNFNGLGDGNGGEASPLSQQQQQLSSSLRQQNQFLNGSSQSPQFTRNSMSGGGLGDLMTMGQTPAAAHRNSLVHMLSPSTIQQLAQLDALGQNTPEQQQQQQNHMMRQLMQRQGSMGSATGNDPLGIPPPPVVSGQGLSQLDAQQQLLLLQQQQRFGALAGMSNLPMGSVGVGAGAGQDNTTGANGGDTTKTDSFDQGDFAGVSALGISPESFGW